MRALSREIIDSLSGSSTDVNFTVNAWYDGQLVAENLEIANWSLSWNRGPQTMVQGQASFTIVDETGKLAPWGYDEPLSVAGSQLQTIFSAGGDSVEIGWWVITSNDPEESWRATSFDNIQRIVPAGATIPIEANELTQLLQDARFISPEAPLLGSTVFAEIQRLVNNMMAVEFQGVVDRNINRSMIYSEERINTIHDLAGLIGEYRMSGDGVLEVYNPAKPAVPHWIMEPGDDGALITVKRSQNRDNLYNAVVSTSQHTEQELREYALLENGPLRFYGPLGPKPKFRNAMAETRAGVKADAATALANEILSSTTVLSVSCLPHPGYQIGDWIQVLCPTYRGKEYPLIGQIDSLSLSGGPDGLEPMSMSVTCSTDDVMKISRILKVTQ